MRRSLLGGLSEYPGEVVEVLEAEEFWALQTGERIHGVLEFSVGFSCDVEGEIQWNIEKCRNCDPLHRRHLRHHRIPSISSSSSSSISSAFGQGIMGRNNREQLNKVFLGK